MKIRCVRQTGNSRIFEIDLSGCKGGSQISWACCKSNLCTSSYCVNSGSSADSSFNKCNSVTVFQISVALTTTQVPIQIHDGQIFGNVPAASCSGGNGFGDNQCCGGSGGSCVGPWPVYTGICQVTVDLASIPCGAAASPSPTVVPGPSPAAVVVPSPSPAAVPSPSPAAAVVPSPSPAAVPSPSPAAVSSPSPTAGVVPSAPNGCITCERFTGSSAVSSTSGYLQWSGANSANACMKICVTANSADKSVRTYQVDMSACKGGNTLSWACCKSNDCVQMACNQGSAFDDTFNKCDTVRAFQIQVPSSVSTVPFQIHDGQIFGNVAAASCSGGNGFGANQCCGGSGGSCVGPWPVYTGICEVTVDLPSVPVCGAASPPPAVVPSPSPTVVVPSPSPTVVAPSPAPTVVVPSPSPTVVVPSPSPTATTSPSPTAGGTCITCDRFTGTTSSSRWTAANAASACMKVCVANSNKNTRTFQVDLRACKGSALSWACCRSTACTSVSCGSGSSLESSFNKCNNASAFLFQVASSVNSVPLQIHDGQISGNVAPASCSGGNGLGANQCCGGSGGSCAGPSNTGICEVTVDLTSAPACGK